jgi:hypothetical protein
MMNLRKTALMLAATLLVACSGGAGLPAASDSGTPAEPPADAATASDVQRYPDIVAVELAPTGDGVYDVTVTVSSPYDTPERYTDGWRVLGPDGTELGTHTLAHDHAAEQPFTRTQSGLEIPDSVTEVTVEGHDQQFGYGGETITVAVPR